MAYLNLLFAVYRLNFINQCVRVEKKIEANANMSTMKKTVFLIWDYQSCFHDGSILAIKYEQNNILLSLESAQLGDLGLQEPFVLSDDGRLKGILHCEDIKSIRYNDRPFLAKLEMLATIGNIVELRIKGNNIHLFIEWVDYGPDKMITIPFEPYCDISIEAAKIYWQNIPQERGCN